MKTNFFTELAKLGAGQISLSVTYSSDDNLMAISVLPIDTSFTDEGLKKLKPFSASVAPEELDQEFFNAISNPIKETKKLIFNTKEYLEQQETAKKLTAKEKEKTDKVAKHVKELKALMEKEDEILSNKAKISNLIKDIKNLDSEHSYAIKCSKKLLELENEQVNLFD